MLFKADILSDSDSACEYCKIASLMVDAREASLIGDGSWDITSIVMLADSENLRMD